MLQPALYYGDITQVALVVFSAILAVVSVGAYRRRPDGRYLLLMVAFSLLCAASAGTALMELSAGLGPVTVEFVEMYLVPTLELLMVVSFLVAILWSAKAKKRRLGVAFVATALVIGVAATTLYVVGSPGVGASLQSMLPAGCDRPSGGFLIIASSMGYNDSIAHGAPVKSWPILDVTQGTDVTITICNTYSQAVSFQVTHYLASGVDAIRPGQVLSVSFLANQTGSFNIYCSVFNPIHVYLQGGELNVL